MQLQDIALRDKLTGRLFFQRAGNAHVDLGNVTLVKQNLDTGIVEQLSAQSGKIQVTHEEPGNLKPRWSLKLDTHSAEALRLINLATETTVRTEILDQTLFVVQPEIGPLDTGYTNIRNARYTGQGTPAYGLDYTVDLHTGIVTILTDLWDDLDFELTFDVPAIKGYVSISESFVRGMAKIVLQDQHPVSATDSSLAPKHELTFSAELRVTDRGDHTGEKFNEFELSLLATSSVTIDSRD